MTLTPMSKSRTLVVRCPVCDKQVAWSEESPWRPFCSQRCRTIDLGDWLTEKNRVPGEEVPPDESDPLN